MHQLVYISTARRDLSASDITTILKASRRNNEREGLTGLLIYDGVRFLQAIEGPEAPLDKTFERIAGDSRHRAIVQLSRQPIERRAFGDWAMGWTPTPTGAAVITSSKPLPEQVDSLTRHLEDRSMRDLFRSFARIDRQGL